MMKQIKLIILFHETIETQNIARIIIVFGFMAQTQLFLLLIVFSS